MTRLIQFANNATSTLAAGITNVATSITVATGTGSRFPSPTGGQYFLATLIDAAGTQLEVVKVTARSGDVLTVVRAQEAIAGTAATAYAFSSGDKIEARLTAGAIGSELDRLDVPFNAVVDVFTGSGSAGPFTLSSDPGSKNNTSVYIAGVYQEKATYTLSGTSLTLGDPVASGVKVEVIYGVPVALSGVVSGPGSSTDNAIARFDGTTGKLIQNSGAKVDDDGNMLVGYSAAPAGFTGYGLVGVNGTTGGALSFGVAGTQVAYLYGETAGAGFYANTRVDIVATGDLELVSTTGTVNLVPNNSGIAVAKVNSDGLLVGYSATPAGWTGYGLVGINGTDGGAVSFGVAGTQTAWLMTASNQTSLGSIPPIQLDSADQLLFAVDGTNIARVNNDGLLVGYSATPTGWPGFGLVGVNGTDGGVISLGKAGTEEGCVYSETTRTWVRSWNGDVELICATGKAVRLIANGTPILVADSSGAIGVGSSPSYGTSGQALLSNGNAAAPSWGNVVTPTGTQTLTNKTIAYASNTLTGVQPTLVSGTNIKTINGASVLGSGDLTVSGTSSLTRSARTSNTILGTADRATLIDITSGTFTQTFTAAATLGSGWWCYIRNSGTGEITLDPNASETIDGLTSFKMYSEEVRLIQCDGTGFNSIVINAFNVTFTATATFTKPPGYSAFSGLLWGGGGSGGKGSGTNRATGAGGGACVPFTFPPDLLSISTIITIAATTVGPTAAATAGSTGGTSSIGSLLSAYGGAGGVYSGSSTASGGGGGGATSAGSSSTGGGPGTPVAGGSDGLSGSNGATGAVGSPSAWGGAAGGGSGTSTSYGAGGNSIYGGAGGGGNNSTSGGSGGVSIFGGNGGAGSGSTSGGDGVAPGGGGGSTHTGTKAGDGARGECRIWGVI